MVAVSKKQDIIQIKKAIALGQYQFGENYIQESVEKIHQLKDNKKIVWHFIGKLQSNKTKIVAENFSWCQSIDRKKIAVLLNKYRSHNMPPINVLIQINISNECTKNGINSADCYSLAQMISLMPNLKLRGIMALPSKKKNIIDKKIDYTKISIIFHKLQKKYSSIDTLSLGTSFDIEESLIANSNMIRIGHAIFNHKK
ncbi:YggS family pyridoxal phosphate-dependent enzyme [Buchnera aphidicola]|uniref:YggS family pyridoxal phosphate-dependent enzyme n=1 Tax=Buchnera aphidicola TaxID=9 RepID=UPI003464BC86